MTDHHGTQLGVDLYQLHLMGTVWLPDVAAQYERALGGLLSADGLFNGLSRSEGLGGPHGPVHGPWLEATRALQLRLLESYKTLTGVAQAVLLAKEAYAGADDAARDELNRLIKGTWVMGAAQP
jgi:hypothetical protein